MITWFLPVERLDVQEFAGFPENYNFEEKRPLTRARFDLKQAFTLPTSSAGEQRTLAWAFFANVVLALMLLALDDPFTLGFRPMILQFYFILRAWYIFTGARAETAEAARRASAVIWCAHSVAVPLAASGMLAPRLSEDFVTLWGWFTRFVCVVLAVVDVACFRTFLLWPHVVYSASFVLLEGVLSSALFGTNPIWGFVALAAHFWCYGIINTYDFFKEELSRDPKFTVVDKYDPEEEEIDKQQQEPERDKVQSDENLSHAAAEDP